MSQKPEAANISPPTHETLKGLLVDGKFGAAMRDIVGHHPREISIEFEKGKPTVGPGGAHSGDGSWDGNIYKYRF